MITKLGGAIALAVAAGAAFAAPNMEELLKACDACHGMDGVATSPKTPHLNWQLPAYLIESMQNMQSGAPGRPTAVPKHIPKSLTREQIVAIAEFYGKNRKPRVLAPFDADKAALGKGVHMDRCMDCHLEDGRATDDKGAATPIVAGQPADYLLAQEKLFMSGKRKFAPQSDRAHRGMTAAEMDQISHYYASINPWVPQPDEDKKSNRRAAK